MSDIGIKIIGAGLVKEGIEFERLEKEVVELKLKLQSKKPICPFCLGIMDPINYSGYYDSFSYWDCDCEKFEKGFKSVGSYA